MEKILLSYNLDFKDFQVEEQMGVNSSGHPVGQDDYLGSASEGTLYPQSDPKDKCQGNWKLYGGDIVQPTPTS